MGAGPNAHPVECFMFDTPKVIDVAALGITSVGVHPVENPDGSVWLYDIVGSEHYPNVADFVEETRRLGISRRLPRSLPWDRLDGRTRLILLHKRAMLLPELYAPYFKTSPAEAVVGRRPCPRAVSNAHCGRGEAPHQGFDPCNRVWYEDIEGGEPFESDFLEPIERRVVRQIAETRYIGFRRPDWARPSYQLAAFLRFPLVTIDVVRDDEGGTHRVIEHVETAGVSVRLTDE